MEISEPACYVIPALLLNILNNQTNIMTMSMIYITQQNQTWFSTLPLSDDNSNETESGSARPAIP